MDRNNIIVGEYLESLSEDGELDHLLPILLRLMGLKVIRTAKEAKGVNQQGKDIIAVGVDKDGIRKRFFLEVKGHADRNITEVSFSKKDGIADSLHSAIHAAYEDLTIPNFNELPKKIVLVHNGTVNPNATDLLNGFVKKWFVGVDLEFERWSIYELSELFSKYLFSEYLLTDKQSLRLFKKTLALIDQPEYDLRDYKLLVNKLLANDHEIRTRAFTKLFSTLNLISILLWQFARESNNLLQAIDGIAYTVLQTWAYILKRNMEKRKAVMREFKKLLGIQRDLLASYFKLTIDLALTKDGLHSPDGGPFEEVSYPIKAMNYLGWLIYYYELENLGVDFENKITDEELIRVQKDQKDTLSSFIENNIGAKTPLLDRHSIPITLFALFFLNSKKLTKHELIALENYVIETLNSITNIHAIRRRYPAANDSQEALVEFVATRKRPKNYSDDSSILLTILLELICIFDKVEDYQTIRENIPGTVALHLAYPDWTRPEEIELKIFEGNIRNLTLVETDIDVPEDINIFKINSIEKMDRSIVYKTDEVGFRPIRLLSYIYFWNDIPPNEWRLHLAK